MAGVDEVQLGVRHRGGQLFADYAIPINSHPPAKSGRAALLIHVDRSGPAAVGGLVHQPVSATGTSR